MVVVGEYGQSVLFVSDKSSSQEEMIATSIENFVDKELNFVNEATLCFFNVASFSPRQDHEPMEDSSSV